MDYPLKSEMVTWFRRRLDAADIDPRKLPYSYGGDTPFDFLCYRLLTEAELHFNELLGYHPGHRALTDALFTAERDRQMTVRRRLKRRARLWWRERRRPVRLAKRRF